MPIAWAGSCGPPSTTQQLLSEQSRYLPPKAFRTGRQSPVERSWALQGAAHSDIRAALLPARCHISVSDPAPTSRLTNQTRTGWKHLFSFVCCCHLFAFVFGDRVFLCSPRCPGTHPADQADFKLKNHLPLPPKCNSFLKREGTACSRKPKPIS